MMTATTYSFSVRDALGRVWVRYAGVVEDYGQPRMIVVHRCQHQHRRPRFAEQCAREFLKNLDKVQKIG
jgi:hypothetical protein